MATGTANLALPAIKGSIRTSPQRALVRTTPPGSNLPGKNPYGRPGLRTRRTGTHVRHGHRVRVDSPERYRTGDLAHGPHARNRACRLGEAGRLDRFGHRRTADWLVPGFTAAGYPPDKFTVTAVTVNGENETIANVEVASPHTPQPVAMPIDYVYADGTWKLAGSSITDLGSIGSTHGACPPLTHSGGSPGIYAYPVNPYPTARPRTDSMATAAMICALVWGTCHVHLPESLARPCGGDHGIHRLGSNELTGETGQARPRRGQALPSAAS